MRCLAFGTYQDADDCETTPRSGERQVVEFADAHAHLDVRFGVMPLALIYRTLARSKGPTQ